MLTPAETKNIQQSYNTHDQHLSPLEAVSLGLLTLSIGDTIDLRSIVRHIPIGTGSTKTIDESKAEMLGLIG